MLVFLLQLNLITLELLAKPPCCRLILGTVWKWKGKKYHVKKKRWCKDAMVQCNRNKNEKIVSHDSYEDCLKEGQQKDSKGKD